MLQLLPWTVDRDDQRLPPFAGLHAGKSYFFLASNLGRATIRRQKGEPEIDDAFSGFSLLTSRVGELLAPCSWRLVDAMVN